MNIKHTNILVPYTIERSDRSRAMNFLCEYIDSERDMTVGNLYQLTISEKEEYVGFYKDVITKQDSILYKRSEISEDPTDNNSQKLIRLYFPVEGLHTYTSNVLYHITIYTYLTVKDSNEEDKYITKKYILFDNVISNLDNLACSPVLYNSVRYQEYQDIRLINIENEIVEKEDVPFLSYLLNISIQPVVREDISTYVAIKGSSTGRSFISFIDNQYLSILNRIDTINKNITSTVSTNNSTYPQLEDYIDSICGDSRTEHVIYFRFFLVNQHTEEIYINRTIKYTGNNSCSISIEDFMRDALQRVEEPWSIWCSEFEGTQISVYIEVYDAEYEHCDPDTSICYIDEDADYIMCISSQGISLTKDKFQDLLSISSDINIVNIDNLKQAINDNMNNVIVNNEIINQKIIVSQSDSQSGIIKPVFYRAYVLGDIYLHRDMRENICINLDDYSNKYDKLYIKICGNYFPEYTRTIDGVVFNVNSSVVTSNTGSYYICNEDKEFITSGKYICE